MQKVRATIRVLLSMVVLNATQAPVDAKLASCKTRFTKKMTHDYCSKFGTEQHSNLNIEVRSKLQNSQHLTVSGGVEHVKVQVATLADQDYERLMKQGEPSCNAYQQAATVIQNIMVPADGSWSDVLPHPDSTYTAKTQTQSRPKIWYFIVLDCDRQLATIFKTGQIPRLTHEIHLTTKNGANEFSYEDQGLLSLHVLLFVLLAILFGMMVNTFLKFYRTEKTFMAPHPIMIYVLACQVTSILLQLLHLWSYSSNGEGSTLSDVLSKVSQGFSEVAMSLLLIMLASGWKLRFQEIDFDDGLEVYLPMTALVLMVHIILIALTFVDVDASHKYHDFAGMQGWCLLVLKTILFAYFSYCIWDQKQQSKKRKDQQDYLSSLMAMGAAYLLAIPLSVLVCFIYEPYERQYIYTLVSQMAMSGANAAMFYMLSSPRSTYRKTSTDDAGLPHMM